MITNAYMQRCEKDEVLRRVPCLPKMSNGEYTMHIFSTKEDGKTEETSKGRG